jgi:AmmeMemoRadiSam system protein B
MKAQSPPRIRSDLEYIPVQQGKDMFVLIRDPLGLVETGKAVPLPLYRMMTLLDGRNSLRDVQMLLMREHGGVLVEMEAVEDLVNRLEASFLMDSEKFQRAREEIEAAFAAKKTRPCSHCGRSYPAEPTELRNTLDQLLAARSAMSKPPGRLVALAAPHIDLSVGSKVYASAYQWLQKESPSRIVVLGVGHQMMGDLFCLTEKAFETPLGEVETDRDRVEELRNANTDVISRNDFSHRAEHSIEFQVVFLKHLLPESSFRIIPILCGGLRASLPAYTRAAYLDMAGAFLQGLSDVVRDPDEKTLIVAGVDLSHIGPKFGHDQPAVHLQEGCEQHDKNLLKALSNRQADAFWEESIAVEDRFNVCGFSALACLLEVLPPSEGHVLNYEMWHEQPTRSAVSFAAVGFVAGVTNDFNHHPHLQ